MPELKPCPFCGHIGLTFNDGSTYRWGDARCAGCDASAGEVRRRYPDDGEWHAAAIEQWNNRAIPADQVLVPKELLERIEESLRIEVEATYCGTKDHPAIRPKYERDIAEADELRALLQR
ncbi:Lar family restriction alleviation protein [Pseudomonas panipatensis]|uniref:Restriction alleviation protein, Lar family n=1 Tax=Pseudomonas panipatensis TaxID=428992 RepID=A0A1G8LHW0_9PSED|nr:Lar family restriction alleviation protein [Pseudomonas panipatensis]SDI55205.1 restriction alleviation protein, Lar family [Pseudomonas panipatensis]SMP74877.1 restriction alleviation protein, Lar family [Pseudomonas panipatensis]